MSTTITPKIESGTTTSSVAQSTELTEAQRKARFKELRERMGQSRLKVEGLPGKHYLWAHKGDAIELDRLDLNGYALVREVNAKEVLAGKAKPKIKAGGLREDGTYIQGDAILMVVDQEVYDYLMQLNDEKSDDMK